MNKLYIEYLNTYGAEIDLGSQLNGESDAFPEEHSTKENDFVTLLRLLCSKYRQFRDLVRYVTVNPDEEERLRLIDSIEKLKREQ